MGVDPNKVRLTGENSFLVLSEVQGGDPTVQNSHWRIHHSPKGPATGLITASECVGLTEFAVDGWRMLPSLPPRFQKSGVPVGMFRSVPASKVGLCQKLPTSVAACNEVETNKRARTLRNWAVIMARWFSRWFRCGKSCLYW